MLTECANTIDKKIQIDANKTHSNKQLYTTPEDNQQNGLKHLS